MANVSHNVDTLRDILRTPDAKQNKNKWADFIQTLEKIIDQIDEGRKVLYTTNQAPEYAPVENLTLLLDDFINSFLGEFDKWCIHNPDERWSTTFKRLDGAVQNELKSTTLAHLTEYIQWRRKNPNIGETKKGISQKRFDAAKGLLPFIREVRIIVVQLRKQYP